MGDSDPFKVAPLRYIGFSLGMAQAARYRFNDRRVDVLVSIGLCFVLAHVLHAAITTQTVVGTVDAFLFEVINTVIIPPVTAYYFCGLVEDMVVRIREVPSAVKEWAGVSAGVLLMPLLHLYSDPNTEKLIQQLVSYFK